MRQMIRIIKNRAKNDRNNFQGPTLFFLPYKKKSELNNSKICTPDFHVQNSQYESPKSYIYVIPI